MTSHLRVSVVVIGDEILGGFVQDTNSGWLAQRLQALGIPLDRVVTVPDETAAIGEALGHELARGRPRVVLTSGGIGSTPDDLTLEAVAAHLGLPLEVQPVIEELIAQGLQRARETGVTITEEHAQSLRKMARVPQGAYLLPGARGFVPGAAVDVDGGAGAGAGGATIVILPGIPSELRRIVLDGVEPVLLEGRGVPQHVAELCHGYPESALNPVLDRVVAEFPDVHVGSYPGRDCTIRLKGGEDRVKEARALVEAFLADLDAHPGAAELSAQWRSHWTETVTDHRRLK